MPTTNFSTIGGQVTRGETYSKLLHHLSEAEDCMQVMGHLHQTEDTDKDRLLAHGWRGMAELIQRLRTQITKLAMGQIGQ